MIADLVATAIRVATSAHRGQTDKAGRPYIGHPARVALAVSRAGGCEEAVAAAWLHDVLEDCPSVTPATLLLEGFSPELVGVVWRLTRKPFETPETYYRLIRMDPLALLVKTADIADNTDPERLFYLDPATQARLHAKYAKAREALGIVAA